MKNDETILSVGALRVTNSMGERVNTKLYIFSSGAIHIRHRILFPADEIPYDFNPIYERWGKKLGEKHIAFMGSSFTAIANWYFEEGLKHKLLKIGSKTLQ
jgi:hypothetical protein